MSICLNDNNLQHLKNVELEILDEFIRICKQHNLRYFLSGGTCLGAIRHQGFIPWDNDIDISMPREDYQKLVDIAPNELNNKYVFQNYKSEPNCGLVFGKIRKKGTVLSEVYSHHINMSQGIWIDIFPYDSIPDDPEERERAYRRAQFLKELYIVKCGYKMPRNRKSPAFILKYYGAKFLCLFVPLSKLRDRLHQALTQYNDAPCSTVFPYGGAYEPAKERLPRTMINEYVDVSFEGRTCKTLRDYDLYLTNLYGDYLTPPPEDKRDAGMHDIYELKLTTKDDHTRLGISSEEAEEHS